MSAKARFWVAEPPRVRSQNFGAWGKDGLGGAQGSGLPAAEPPCNASHILDDIKSPICIGPITSINPQISQSTYAWFRPAWCANITLTRRRRKTGHELAVTGSDGENNSAEGGENTNTTREAGPLYHHVTLEVRPCRMASKSHLIARADRPFPGHIKASLSRQGLV